MASLRQVGERWVIRFKDVKRTPTEVSFRFAAQNFPTRDIKVLKKELEVQYEKGEWDPWTGRLPSAGDERAPITLKEAVGRYCQLKRTMGRRRQKGGWNENTYQNYSVRFAAFARRLGERRQVSSMRSEDLARYVHDEDVKPDTQKTRRRYIATFLKWLVAEGYASAQQIKMPPAMVLEETLGTYCTEDELEVICRAHEEGIQELMKKKHTPKTGPAAPRARLWMTAAWRFAFYQGLRRGELLAMRVGGCDASAGLMVIGDKTFIPKDKKEAVVALTPPAAAVVTPFLTGRPAAEFVWPPRHRKQITSAFKAAVRRAIRNKKLSAEQEGLHLHNLRDSGCMYWLRKGVDLRHVRDLLRHKSLKTTLQHYYHIEVEQQSEAFRRAFEGASAATARGSNSGASGQPAVSFGDGRNT